MEIYKAWDFCKSIDCLNVGLKHKEGQQSVCELCPAYLMHNYLHDHGQILEEGSELAGQEAIIDEYHRLAERQNARNAALREENDLQRQSIQDLSAQVAKMQAVVQSAKGFIDYVYRAHKINGLGDFNNHYVKELAKALAALEGGER
jgi:hypothetical protein